MPKKSTVKKATLGKELNAILQMQARCRRGCSPLLEDSKELFNSVQGVQVVVPSPRSQRSAANAAEVAQGAKNWAQLENLTPIHHREQGAQPHRFPRIADDPSVRHGLT